MTGYRILRFALMLLLIFPLLTGLTSLTLGGFMDFPCFVNYDEQRNCVTHHDPGSIEGGVAAQIKIYLTTYAAGMRSGGRNHKETDANILDVPASVIDPRFERDVS